MNFLRSNLAKKRRATVIFEKEEGILLTRMSSEPWLLPGGHAEKGEPRIIAAIRELYEETRLNAIEVKYLFDFESKNYLHKVFLIKAIGASLASSEVSFLDYFHIDKHFNVNEINKSSFAIIKKYL